MGFDVTSPQYLGAQFLLDAVEPATQRPGDCRLCFCDQVFYGLVGNAQCEQASLMAKIHSAAALKIGQRVRSARQHLGISLEDLGELAEVSWTSIGKIERGAQSPNVETIVRLATALDVEPGEFLTGVTADDYGQRPHRLTARDLINARAARGAAASEPATTTATTATATTAATTASQPTP